MNGVALLLTVEHPREKIRWKSSRWLKMSSFWRSLDIFLEDSNTACWSERKTQAKGSMIKIGVNMEMILLLRLCFHQLHAKFGSIHNKPRKAQVGAPLKTQKDQKYFKASMIFFWINSQFCSIKKAQRDPLVLKGFFYFCYHRKKIKNQRSSDSFPTRNNKTKARTFYRLWKETSEHMRFKHPPPLH